MNTEKNKFSNVAFEIANQENSYFNSKEVNSEQINSYKRPQSKISQYYEFSNIQISSLSIEWLLKYF